MLSDGELCAYVDVVGVLVLLQESGMVVLLVSVLAGRAAGTGLCEMVALAGLLEL